ncbi:putative short-chain dehydrogenase [Hypoxylon sp. FL1284]|nr:putative short-chain dehydrogenase [Hypoxylon sp. FL1284]
MNYTKVQHNKPYAAISPKLPQLSAASKTVLVAGGSAGIGKAAAAAFLEAGSTAVALTGRREPALAAAAAELRAAHPRATILTFVADAADAAATEAAFAGARDALGGAPLDVVVNCAYHQPPLAGVLDEASWWRAFEVNVRGAATVARCAARYGAGTGSVLLHLSTAAAVAPAGGLPVAAYAASKLAAVKVMEYVGAENPGLRVVSVHPGIVVDSPGGRKFVKDTGIDWPGDDINLPAHFLVWAASKEADFLKNKFVFANWDVDELKARKDEISQTPELTIGLNGFPRNA